MSLISIFPNTASSVDDLEIDAILEEVHTDTMRITEHPVEKGAAITDHAYKEPTELVMKCGWSQSSISAVSTAIKAAGAATVDTNDMGTGPDHIGSMYGNFLRLQEQRKLVTVVTNKRRYSNMVITSLGVVTDEKTSNILVMNVTLRGVRIVATKATTLPDKSKLAEGASTDTVTFTGPQAATLI